MVRLARGIKLPDTMPIDRLHHAHPGEDHRAAVLCGLSDAMRGGLNLLHSVLSFASHAIASASVRSFLPSGSSTGSSKRRDQPLSVGILFPAPPGDQACPIIRVARVADQRFALGCEPDRDAIARARPPSMRIANLSDRIKRDDFVGLVRVAAGNGIGQAS